MMRKRTLSGIVVAVMGCACALLLGAVFFCAMAYQLSAQETQAVQPPVGTLALAGAALEGESVSTIEMDGTKINVLTRTYALDSGEKAQAITADSPAYLQRIAQEKWTVQPVTGFVLAGLDAVYAVREGQALLAAHGGGHVWMLICPQEEQTAYALGAAAMLE